MVFELIRAITILKEGCLRMIYKDTDIHFSINSQIKRSIAANIQFSTQDIDTAKLTFSLTKDGIPLPISQAT
ncbi:BppU family phage baseplate upper protein, partial [Bacillus licheniformis]|uniref:BppU family phage baseplate upper protein n=1 Tax=Bacillus licheniformis TaxID=1402 RepID=UPI003F8D1A41